jgi:hypothetical protein
MGGAGSPTELRKDGLALVRVLRTGGLAAPVVLKGVDPMMPPWTR